MTTTIDALKAARGRLQDLRESEFYWGKFLAVTRCGIHEAITLLDAAIQREEAQPPSGVVSREGDWTTDEEWIDGFVGDLAHDEGLSEKCAAYMRRELAMRFREVRSLAAPSEPPKASAVSREALGEFMPTLLRAAESYASDPQHQSVVRDEVKTAIIRAHYHLSAPSEPMVPRARAWEAILDALTFDGRGPDERKDHFDRWRRETADRIAARILDGGGHE